MTNSKKNIAASVFERLKNVAKKNNRSMDSILLLYFQERLLYRLSKSPHRDRFLLKGGLFLFSLTKFSSRPTRDIDFLATYISNEIKNIEQAFIEVCSLDIEDDDGLVYHIDQMSSQRIKEDANYEGVRIKIPASLGRARNVLQLDIGFGDIIIPNPQAINFPVLLGMEQPNILTYSIESVIAEKFEAMISLSIVNSRMKDFYDIYILSESENFEGRVLQEAIMETFGRRKTILEKEHPLFSEEFYLDSARIRQWDAFIRRIGVAEIISFEMVMKRIHDFIYPIYQTILHEDEFFGRWDVQKTGWR